MVSSFIFFFFFQAEDGIRDRNVTGVQTCALPIFTPRQCRPPLGVPPRLDAVSRLDSQWVVAAGARPDRLQRRRRGAVSGPVVECRSLEGELLAGILKRPYSAMVPCRYRRASPTIFTRSPVTLHCIEPPRALSCCARNVCFPSRPAQYG